MKTAAERVETERARQTLSRADLLTRVERNP
jgi:hypothetical protein